MNRRNRRSDPSGFHFLGIIMTEKQSTKTLLERYAPKRLNEISGQETIIKILKGYVKNNNIPHMIFTGSPGIGKTLTATCLARELFGDHWRKNFISMNSSDERGIDTVRNKIKNATQYAPIGGYPFKIIFLDESDELTESAQRALREVIIRHQSITRFIFGVNNINKVISPIQDRTQIFRFKSLQSDTIKHRIMGIAKEEKIDISPQNLLLIAYLSKGSMRRAINCLQSLSVLDSVDEGIIRELLDTTCDTDHSRKLLKRVLTTDVEKYEEELFRLVYANAFEPSEILQGLMNELMAANDPSTLPAIITLAEGDWRISQGANGMLQARCSLFRVNQLKNKDKIIEVMK